MEYQGPLNNGGPVEKTHTCNSERAVEHYRDSTGFLQWYFPVFYAVTAIPHIVDVTSVTGILVVLLFGMIVREHMPMMTGVVCIFLYFMQ